MIMKYNIFYLLICVALLFSCTAEECVDIPMTDATEKGGQAEVVFNLSIPAQELPTTRSISNDSQINSYKILIFKGKGEDATFYEEVKDEDVSLKTTPSGAEQLFILLPESEEEITLSVIANVPNVTTPTHGTSKVDALNTLEYSIDSAEKNGIPMYGEQTLTVKQGLRTDIGLRRAMAKIQVDTSSAFNAKLFRLESVELLNINKSGKVVSGIIPTAERTDLKQDVEGDNCIFYIPEISEVNGDRKVSVLIKGKYKDHPISSYYRLEFIKREGALVENIERNYKYVFLITNMTSSGYTDRDDAINSPASNVSGAGMVLQVIDNERIMDITTDGSYFLGVTTSSVTAEYNADYYFVNISVQSNNPSGWNMITSEFPIGVSTSMDKFNPNVTGVEPNIINSVWIYIEKGSATSSQKVNVYIYSGGIRKKIEITIP